MCFVWCDIRFVVWLGCDSGLCYGMFDILCVSCNGMLSVFIIMLLVIMIWCVVLRLSGLLVWFVNVFMCLCFGN